MAAIAKSKLRTQFSASFLSIALRRMATILKILFRRTGNGIPYVPYLGTDPFCAAGYTGTVF